MDVLSAGAAIDEVTGADWGRRMVDALATPGATRVRLYATVGNHRITITLRSDGEWVGTPIPIGTPVNGHLRLWGRSAGDCVDVRKFIDWGRIAAGLAPLGAAWGLTAVDIAGCGWVLDTDI